MKRKCFMFVLISILGFATKGFCTSSDSSKTVHAIIRDTTTVQVILHDSVQAIPVVSSQADSTRIPMLMDFGGNRCKNCIITKKRLEKIEKKFKGKAKIISIDVNKEKELTKKYKILLIPTLVFLDKTGKEVYRKTGLMEEKAMSTKLEELTK
ncbi:MAG: thioredoxin family protein [bacterium]|nr:thioredoxin family protein [bacterium]